jgi:hypothetical protein
MVHPNFEWVTKNIHNPDAGPRDAPNAMAWNVLQFVRARPENRGALLLVCSLIWPSRTYPNSATPADYPDLTDEELSEQFQKEWESLVAYYERRDQLLAAEAQPA